MKLCDCVNIITNNDDCVVLEVKDDRKKDLISLGYFNLDEKMYRLTKGKNHTCTIFKDDFSSYSFYWGESGCTLVSDSVSKKGKLIEKCIEEDFDIYIGDNKNLISKTKNINSIDDTIGAEHNLVIMYWNENDNNLCVHKDGEFYKFFNNKHDLYKHLENLGYSYKEGKSKIAKIGCICDELYVIRDRLKIKNKDDLEL